MAAHLQALDAAFAALADFDPASTEAALRAVAEARGVKAGALIHAVRVAVTGTTVSPGLFEVLALVGRPASAPAAWLPPRPPAIIGVWLASHSRQAAAPDTGRSSNGRTSASGAGYRGSNPCLPARLRSPSASFV